MQKSILILCYSVNLCVVFFGYSLIARYSSEQEFESFTILLLIINMFGLVESGRAVVVSASTNIQGADFSFIRKVFFKQTNYALVLGVLFFCVSYYHYSDLIVSTVISISIPSLMYSSLCLGAIESRQMPGTAGIPKMLALFVLFSFSIASFYFKENQSVLFPFLLYVLVNCLLSYAILFFLSLGEGVINNKNIAINSIVIKDSFWGGVYRAYVDYLDRFFLIFFFPASSASIYMSRMELAQKYVNIAQLISYYIYPKLCSANSLEYKWRYLKSIFLPCFLAVYFILLCVNFHAEEILSLYFHDPKPKGVDVFLLFTTAFVFNFTSFFFVPYLRSINDFKTSKMAFLSSSVLLTIAFLLLFLFGDISLVNVAICFMLSKLPYSLNIFASFNSVYSSQISLFYTVLIVFMKTMLLIPVFI